MRTVLRWVTLAVVALAARTAAAGECQTGCPAPCAAQAACGDGHKCGRCGGCGPCVAKTCQLQCGVEKVKKYCWVVECSEFCPLLPGCGKDCGGCGQCSNCNDGCAAGCAASCDQGCGGDCGPPKKYVTPRCTHPKCVKKLVKKEYDCDVPVYKCVVVYLCDSCCNAQQPAPAAAPAVPAAPAAPAVPPPLPPKDVPPLKGV